MFDQHPIRSAALTDAINLPPSAKVAEAVDRLDFARVAYNLVEFPRG